MPEGSVWPWFRRVLLGTVIEGLHEVGLPIDASSIELSFDEDSLFQFPAFDNHLRFVGRVRARVDAEVPPEKLRALREAFEPAWPALVTELRRFPLPDRLVVVRNEVTVEADGARLNLVFDLEAD
ncbi:MAG: hypothetical protein EA397_06435 [Deltaproteobacteria bacterium]|nr:MAG: hypothetical protein EA397_06435 [Deltaproteobacteria bacterium]